MKNADSKKITSIIFTVIALIISGIFAYNGIGGDDAKTTSAPENPAETYTYNINIPEAGSDDYYTFRYKSNLAEHYKKHKADTRTSSKEEYLYRANYVIYNENSLHKNEKEDGDDIYYLASTNELVIVSKDGYIRTYFCPDNGREYFDRQ